MDISPKWLLPAVAAGFLTSACTQIPSRQSSPPPADTGDATADVVYHSLAADIAARRGLLDDAYGHYVWLARETRSSDAAEKAARIGLHLQKNGDTLKAAELWAELVPDDPGAQEVKATLFLNEGRPVEAYAALQAIVTLGNAQGKNGYAEAASVITAAENPSLGKVLIEQLAAADSRNSDAHYANALVLFASGDYVAAESAVRRSLRLNSHSELTWLLLSRVRARLAGEAASGEALKAGVGANPNSRLLRIAYARWLVEEKDYDAAYRQFKKLLELMPDDPDILFSVGALATDLERWQEARRYWARLIDQGERVDEARYFLAEVEESTGNEDRALGLYRKVQGGPLRLEAATRVAEILAGKGDISGARRVLAEQRVLFPDHAVSLYLIEAELMRDYGFPEEAAVIYDTALSVFPGDPDLLYARAMYAADEQRLEASERDLRMILEQDPDHADALNALGYTLIEQSERYQEAFDLISRALKLRPESAAILDSMGWVQYRLGNLEAAVSYLKRAAEKDANSEIAAHLGEVLWASGQHDEALRVWREALGRDPESAYLRETLQRLRVPTP